MENPTPAELEAAVTKALVPHPGAVLEQQFLKRMEMSLSAACERLGLRPQYFRACVTGQIAFLPETLHKISKLVGTTPYFWFDLQEKYLDANNGSVTRPDMLQAQHAITKLSNLCLVQPKALTDDGVHLVVQEAVLLSLVQGASMSVDLTDSLFIKFDYGKPVACGFDDAEYYSKPNAEDVVSDLVKMDIQAAVWSYDLAVKNMRRFVAARVNLLANNMDL